MTTTTPSPSTLTTKRERIEFLLDHYTDFYETLHLTANTAGSDDEAVSLMPRMSRHPSVVELAAAIGRARSEMPVRTAHMMAFYTAEWRNTTRTVKKKAKGGKHVTLEVRVRERVIPAWVRHEKVRAAVVYVTDSFRGEVFIPTELLEAAA